MTFDDTDDELATPGLLSDLEQAAADAASYDPPDLRYVHPTLDKYILVFRHDLDWGEMDTWRKKCITKPAKNGREAESDAAKFGRMVIAGTSIGIENRGADRSAMKGEPLIDSRGNPVTFGSREFMTAFKVATAADCVKAFIRSDSAIASLSNRIIDDNGVGGDVEALPDPTSEDETSRSV